MNTSTSRRPIRFALAGCAMCAAVLLTTTTASGQSLAERVRRAKIGESTEKTAGKAEALRRLVYTDITVDFTETSVERVVEFIRQVSGANILARYNDDRTATGLDRETLINLKVVGRPALQVIEMMLDQCASDLGEECTWQLRNGYVEIGTKDRLDAKPAQETRYYPIRDLIFEIPDFDNAPDFSLDDAFSQGGTGGGTGGGGSGGGGGGFGGSGGGGGGGRGGGGSGGGSGSGSLFGDPDDIERETEEDRAQAVVDLIQESVERDRWEDFGGTARMRYWQGTLIITAPDYIHRQINGYPFSLRGPSNARRIADGSPDLTPIRRVTLGKHTQVTLDGREIGSVERMQKAPADSSNTSETKDESSDASSNASSGKSSEKNSSKESSRSTKRSRSSSSSSSSGS